jgi:hypothetical protein
MSSGIVHIADLPPLIGVTELSRIGLENIKEGLDLW